MKAFMLVSILCFALVGCTGSGTSGDAPISNDINRAFEGYGDESNSNNGYGNNGTSNNGYGNNGTSNNRYGNSGASGSGYGNNGASNNQYDSGSINGRSNGTSGFGNGKAYNYNYDVNDTRSPALDGGKTNNALNKATKNLENNVNKLGKDIKGTIQS